MMFASLCSAVLAAACLMMHAHVVDAHGWLATPRSRNLISRGANFYASGGNGLGPIPFRAVGSPGVCGDPYQEQATTNFAWQGFSSQATYASGGIINVEVMLNVNHGGKFEFSLCNRNSNLDQACFDSNRLRRCATDILAGLTVPCFSGITEYRPFVNVGPQAGILVIFCFCPLLCVPIPCIDCSSSCVSMCITIVLISMPEIMHTSVTISYFLMLVWSLHF